MQTPYRMSFHFQYVLNIFIGSTQNCPKTNSNNKFIIKNKIWKSKQFHGARPQYFILEVTKTRWNLTHAIHGKPIRMKECSKFQ